MRYFSASGLDALARYSYEKVRTGERSIAARLLRPWWKLVADYVPRWVAPNLITAIGLALMCACYAIVAVRMPLVVEPYPSSLTSRLLLVLCGALVFGYSTCDAVDGIVARRTRTASALGELVDHTADSLSIVLLSLSIASVVQLGAGWASFAICAAICLSFFTAEWELKNTGRRRFGHVNSTEGRLLAVGLFLFTAVVSPSFWLAPLTEPLAAIGHEPFRTGHAAATVAVTWCSAVVLSRLALCFRACELSLAGLARPASHLVPLTASMCFTAAWAAVSPSGLLASHPRTVIGLVGLHTSRLMSSMLVARLSGQSFPVYHTLLLPLPFALFNAYSAAASGRAPLVDEALMLYVQFAVTLAVYCRFLFRIVTEMRDAMRLALFVLDTHPSQD